MTDEVAEMPQSLLREVVLRLIRPETPPSITDSNPLHLRERLATDILRTQAVRQLHRSREAVDLLNRFNAQAALLDEIADLFLTAIETPAAHEHLLNPYVRGMLVFEEVLYTYEIAKLGASPATLERLQHQLVVGGWWRQAEVIAEKLGRKLTRAEVLRMAESYTKGASQGDSEDKFWPEFAERHLGREGGDIVREWIREKAERWANDLY